MEKRVIISASSDIGYELAKDWLDKGVNVVGTYRTFSEKVINLDKIGVSLLKLDLSDRLNFEGDIEKLRGISSEWTSLVFAIGTQLPIGRFETIDILEWIESIHVNFLAQAQILRSLLTVRSLEIKNPTVIFFAGGGTNNATENYSAYTLSKIALIKFCELLAFEIKDIKFSILGPGWVNTKIHLATLQKRVESGANYERTLKKIQDNDMVPIHDVIECINWVIDSPILAISGRNLSVVNDPWREEKLINFLLANNEAFKLRRDSNLYFG